MWVATNIESNKECSQYKQCADDDKCFFVHFCKKKELLSGWYIGDEQYQHEQDRQCDDPCFAWWCVRHREEEERNKRHYEKTATMSR